MRIVLCDDNERILRELEGDLHEFFASWEGKRPEIVSFTSGDELIWSQQTADIAFLDVELDGLSGIQVGKALKERNHHVLIFIVTSYPEYLDEAMEYSVFRYLTKPINKQRLFRNLEKGIARYNSLSYQVFIPGRESNVVCQAEEIVCIEAQQRRTLLTTLNGVIESTEGIEHWKNELSLPYFYSPYRSFLINLKYVAAIEKDKVLLSYPSGRTEAYLARRKYTEFKQIYLRYLESVR